MFDPRLEIDITRDRQRRTFGVNVTAHYQCHLRFFASKGRLHGQFKTLPFAKMSSTTAKAFQELQLRLGFTPATSEVLLFAKKRKRESQNCTSLDPLANATTYIIDPIFCDTLGP
jgi:hypothetical protein